MKQRLENETKAGTMPGCTSLEASGDETEAGKRNQG
jgi:hypothetical protein